MKTLFNEIWFLFVIGKWNWIGLSYELEDWDNEIRGWWWKSFEFRKVDNYYLRLQIWKQVIIIETKKWLKLKKNKKIWLKFMFGAQINNY